MEVNISVKPYMKSQVSLAVNTIYNYLFVCVYYYTKNKGMKLILIFFFTQMVAMLVNDYSIRFRFKFFHFTNCYWGSP
jgi:hypothetical protein